MKIIGSFNLNISYFNYKKQLIFRKKSEKTALKNKIKLKDFVKAEKKTF